MTRPTLVRCWIVELVLSDPFEERPGPAFLEQSHEGGCESLLGSGWHLGNGCLRALPLLHVTARNLLELQVLCNVGGDKDVCKLSIGHEQLGDEVDVPVVGAAIVEVRIRREPALLVELLGLARHGTMGLLSIPLQCSATQTRWDR